MFPRPAIAVRYAVIVALAPLPLLALMPGTLAGRYDYAFAPAGVIGAFFLARARLRRTPAVWPGNRSIGRVLLAAAAATLSAATVLRSPWGAAMALILTAAACTWDYGGRPALRAVIPPLVLVALCVPLPLDLDRTAIAFLARAAARWASHFLDLLGVAHVWSYEVLTYSGGRLDVADLLGGPFSPFALAALLLGLALLLRRGFWRIAILMTMGLAFFAVVTAAAAAAQVAWPSKVPEVVWAAGSMALAIGLAFSFDQWLGIRTAYDLPPNPVTADVVLTAPFELNVVGGALGRGAAVGFASLAVVQICALAVAAAPAPSPAAPGNWFPASIKPGRVAAWTLDSGAPPDLGGATAGATFRSGDRKLILVISPAAAGSPVADLEALGWVVRTPALYPPADESAVVAALELPAVRFAMVWASGLAPDGRRVAPPKPLFGPIARARAALARPFGGNTRGADWWVRGLFVTPWVPTARDLVEPAAVFRSACDGLGRRLGTGGGS